MLDSEIRRVAEDQIGLAFEEQDRLLARAYVDKLSGYSQRGVLISSMAAHAVGELGGNDMRVRGAVALAQLEIPQVFA